MAVNPDKLNEFLGKAIVDFGATFHAALIRIGDKLGLYKALGAGGPQTASELAMKTGTAERYVREWLCSQAAGGYVTYDSGTGKFHLTEEQAFALADENSPAFLPGAFQSALAAVKAEERLTECFKTGKGMGWHEHHPELFVGTERFLSRLCGKPSKRLDSVTRRSRGETQERGPCGGRRLRFGSLNDSHGEVLSEVGICGFRLSRQIHRDSEATGSRGWSRGSHPF